MVNISDSNHERLAEEGQRLKDELSSLKRQHAQEIEAILASEQRARDEVSQAYQRSASWRLTAPVRAVSNMLRALAGRKPEAARAGGAPRQGPSSGRVPALTAKDSLRAAFKTRLDVFLSSGGNLKMPASEKPDVSIILILFNQAELTYACLASIAEVCAGSRLGIEVVILDNASSDSTRLLLERIEGARIIRSDKNLHFLLGSNRATQEAHGRYLLFLNNDAILMPGAIETAVAESDADVGIGAIGGRIVLPDGNLQEAGSIVWDDGTCVGYGRGRGIEDAEFMFKRDVDYCSGAFLLTPRSLFEKLGRFDERYAPAYYEETDYCLRVWQSGHRVAFDPDIVIMHYEFGSSSTSESALELQRRNLGIFRDRHQAWLEGQLPSAAHNMTAARAARDGARRILFIEDRVPHPRLGAGYPRSCEMVRELDKAGARVTVFPMFRHAESWQGIRRTIAPSVEVMRDDSAASLAKFLRDRRGFYDAILVCRPHNMREFLAATRQDVDVIGITKVFYDAEALFASRTLLERRLAGQPVPPEQAERMVAEEIALTRTADAIISVSQQEKSQFESHGVGPVLILSHPIDPAPAPARFDRRSDLLFVGAIHEDESPNADSLRWFTREVLPQLRRLLGHEIRLKVVGVNRAQSIRDLSDQGLDLVGPVDSLSPAFENARVMIAPTRIAAGIPLKVLDAAAHGVPTVVTPLLATQLGWLNGRDLLAAESAAAFAEACARLYTDEALWTSVRDSALGRVSIDCSRDRFRATISQLLACIPQRPGMPGSTAQVDAQNPVGSISNA